MLGFWTPIEEQRRAWFPSEQHPNQILAAEVEKRLTPTSNVLDIGCGRTAPMLQKLCGKAERLYGIDLVDFTISEPDLSLHHNNIGAMDDIPDSSIDIAYSRAVMEHIDNPDEAFSEIARVLKPGGVYIYVTPSLFDYGTAAARMVPNRFHGKIVRMTEGRAEEDVFPTVYASNSLGIVRKQVAKAGLILREGRYLGQYPSYFMFNRVLFWLGSLYQKAIEKYELTQPLQGWMYCVVEQPVSSDS
ncbi:MAG: class I SAM-dependent methyltransferase [Pseudomonadota bacterium]